MKWKNEGPTQSEADKETLAEAMKTLRRLSAEARARSTGSRRVENGLQEKARLRQERIEARVKYAQDTEARQQEHLNRVCGDAGAPIDG